MRSPDRSHSNHWRGYAFIFEDEPASQHPYIYCEDDPVNKQDADGEVAISIPGEPGLPLIDPQTAVNYQQACRDLSWMIPLLYNQYVAPAVNNLIYPSTRAYDYGKWNLPPEITKPYKFSKK